MTGNRINLRIDDAIRLFGSNYSPEQVTLRPNAKVVLK